MKLFAFTDTHGNLELIIDIIAKIKKEQPSFIICSGDLSNYGRKLKTLLLKFEPLKIPFIFTPGNHESFTNLSELKSRFPFLIYLHKASYETNNYLFFGYGEGGFEKKDLHLEAIIPKFKRLIKKNQKIITVTHAPPFNTKLDRLEIGHQGSLSVRKLITEIKPYLHICGHLHENENKEDKIEKTLIINPGKGRIVNI